MANKKRLIDANEAFEMIIDFAGQAETRSAYAAFWKAGKAIQQMPTVDAVEVVHGRWEDFCRGKMCCCSVCKAEFDNTCNEIHGEWYYCPNCGAKMDGDGE